MAAAVEMRNMTSDMMTCEGVAGWSGSSVPAPRGVDKPPVAVAVARTRFLESPTIWMLEGMSSIRDWYSKRSVGVKLLLGLPLAFGAFLALPILAYSFVIEIAARVVKKDIDGFRGLDHSLKYTPINLEMTELARKEEVK